MSALGMLTSANVVQAYTRCAPLQHDENKHVKVIANTKFTLAAGPDPHTFLYTPGKFAVTERFVRVNGPKSEEVSEDKVSVKYHDCMGNVGIDMIVHI